MLKRYVQAMIVPGLLLLLLAAMSCGNDQVEHDVAYVIDGEQRHLYLLKKDGEHSKVIKDSVFEPQWTPNQSKLAYIANATDGVGELKVWDREAEALIRVPGSTSKVEAFFWSPDSHKIAYQSNSDDDTLTEVYVHDFETDHTVRLASESLGNIELGNWSGDNEWIVMCLELGDTQGIYKRSVQGVDEVQLTDYEDSRPRFSYDGKRVAFLRKLEDGSTDIYSLDVDTGNGLPSVAKVLTQQDGDEAHFQWSPDGRNIVYVSEVDGNPEIYAIDTRDKHLRRMTNNRIVDTDPQWSLNGNKILFRSDTDGKYSLFSMDFDSRAQVRILNANESIIAADW